MVMSPATLQAQIERFMVPVGPTGTEDPELGWPDGVVSPPPPISGTTVGGATSNTTFASSLITPAAIGGYAALPPYWAGAKILAVATPLVTLDSPASSPDGPQTADVTATAGAQALFSLPGAPNVALVQSITRLSDSVAIAVDAANGGHDPSHGVIAIGAPSPAIANGNVLRFVYLKAFAGPVPAGVAFTVAPPKPPTTAPLSTGQAWAAAFKAMALEGAANGIPPTTLDAAETAMRGVIDGMMSTPGLGPISLQAGAAAFWGVVAGGFAAIFPAAVGFVPPPTLAGMSAAVISAGASSLAIPIPDPWNPTASQAAAALFAAAIYSSSLGGLVIFQPGPSPVPFPFL